MRWGLLGGTFDPIHIGHLRCAEEIRELFSLDRVLFIPASRPPHKAGPGITSFEERATMVRLAIAGNPHFAFSDLEYKREGMSYSVETVDELLSQQAGLELYFIIGQDAFQEITTWREWERLLSSCHTVVITRPGYKNTGLADILPPAVAARFDYDAALEGHVGPGATMVYFRPVSLLDISSSDLRNRVRAGKSIRYLVPEAVRSHIEATGCYR